jgi:hypothetical protein
VGHTPAVIARAVVVMVTTYCDKPSVERLREDGVTVQVPSVGAPEQERASVPEKPPVAAAVRL